MELITTIKKAFLDGYGGIGVKAIVVAFAFSCLFAAYIYLTYRLVTKKKLYSKSFNMSLAGVCVISTALVLTIQTNIVVSLGMIGALSIVRFRTALKDPMDLMFLFWSISAGIICGAGVVEIAIVASVVLTLGLLLVNFIPVIQTPMLLVINSSNLDCENKVVEVVKPYCKHFNVKSRNMTTSSVELIIELRTHFGRDLVKEVMKIDGTVRASLMTHEGESTF